MLSENKWINIKVEIQTSFGHFNMDIQGHVGLGLSQENHRKQHVHRYRCTVTQGVKAECVCASDRHRFKDSNASGCRRLVHVAVSQILVLPPL